MNIYFIEKKNTSILTKKKRMMTNGVMTYSEQRVAIF